MASTPFAVRGLRVLRLTLHLFRGLATVSFLFPRWAPARRRAAVRRWSRRLLTIVALRMHCEGLPDPLPERCLVVLNHVSWLDIFLVDALHPATFVAKSEIRRWPLAGTLVSRVGTLYLERGSRKAAHRANELVSQALAGGTLVACFPEGETTHGHGVARFHGALFQPAIDAAATVLPVAVRYLDRSGRPSQACSYVGDDSFLKSVWRIVSARAIVAELRFLEPIRAEGWSRRELARRAHSDIAGSLAAG